MSNQVETFSSREILRQRLFDVEYTPNVFQRAMDRIWPNEVRKPVTSETYQENRNVLRGMLYSDFRKFRTADYEIE